MNDMKSRELVEVMKKISRTLDQIEKNLDRLISGPELPWESEHFEEEEYEIPTESCGMGMLYATEGHIYTDCYLGLSHYINMSPAIELRSAMSGHIAWLTAMIGRKGDGLGAWQSLVNTKDHPEIEEFIRAYKLGEPTGESEIDSEQFCYPIYQFDIDRVMHYCKE